MIRPEVRDKFQAVGPKTLRRMVDAMPAAEQHGRCPIPDLSSLTYRPLACEAQAWLLQLKEVDAKAQHGLLFGDIEAKQRRDRVEARKSWVTLVGIVVAAVASLISATPVLLGWFGRGAGR